MAKTYSSRARIITFNKKSLSLAEWARKLKIKANTLLYRLNTMDKEKALTMPKKKTVTFNGKPVILKELVKQYGIKLTTVEYRLYQLKWDLEKALTTPVNKRIKEYIPSR